MDPLFILIEEPPRHRDPAELLGKERDALLATWEERRWVRRKAVTRQGREIALALPTGTVLHPGHVLHVGTDFYLDVEAAPEPVYAVFPKDHHEALRVAFEVGNRHFSLAIDGDRLLVPEDTAMDQLLSRLGVRFEKAMAVFTPVGAGHRH